MNKNVDQLIAVADLISPILKELKIKVLLDLQENEGGNQLCIDSYIICSDGESYDVIEPLDNGDNVCVLCFPAAVYVARYIVGKLICRSVM